MDKRLQEKTKMVAQDSCSSKNNAVTVSIRKHGEFTKRG